MNAAATPLRRAQRSIVGPVYDALFFLLAPAIAFGLGYVLHASGAPDVLTFFGGEDRPVVDIALGVLIQAHLVAVFARSHLDPPTFRRFPIRFVVVPLALYAALLTSAWVTAASIVVATFWDVYHSGAQTFGLARIYDQRAGRVDDAFSRRLDFLVNQALYAGPIAAGVTLSGHIDSFESFLDAPGPLAAMLATVPTRYETIRASVSTAVLAVGAMILLAYVVHQVVRYRRGESISPESAFLVASTGVVSLVSWGLNPFGEAFFIMNVFHAVQYLALIHASETPRLARRFLGSDTRAARGTVLVAFLALVFGYGVFVEWLDPSRHALWSLTMVVSLMHFWYDGFLWSVRRGEA